MLGIIYFVIGFLKRVQEGLATSNTLPTEVRMVVVDENGALEMSTIL